jgi:ABC-type transporter Mla subunit MlaD
MPANNKSIKDILESVSQEINQVNQNINSSIASNSLDDSQIQTWINNLNQLIRKLDHMVENLEEMQH